MTTIQTIVDIINLQEERRRVPPPDPNELPHVVFLRYPRKLNTPERFSLLGIHPNREDAQKHGEAAVAAMPDSDDLPEPHVVSGKSLENLYGRFRKSPDWPT